MAFVPLKTLLVGSTLLIAQPLSAQSAPAFRLEHIATYGWSDSSKHTMALTVSDKKLLAGELGAAAGSIEGMNGDVFVLDPVNKKVAVFDRNGLYLRAFGGEGEGPGEFRRPGEIATGPDGSVYVWDRQLKRVSQFTSDGKNVSQVSLPTVPTVTAFTVVGNRAWFVRSVISHGFAVRAFDLSTGVAVDSFAPLADNEVSISGFGSPGAITTDKKHEIIFAGPFPIQLRIWSAGNTRSVGTNQFAALRGVASEQGVRNTPVSVRGIAVRPDGSYVMVYSTGAITPANINAPLKFWLELIAQNGSSLGKIELSHVESAGRIAVTANGDLLVSMSDDFPQVRRLRVVVGGSGRN